MALKVLEGPGYVGGDFVVAEGDAVVTRESRTIDNSAGLVDLEVPVGQPMTANALTASAGVAALDGLVMEPHLILAGEKKKVAVLARGPAAINQDRLPTHDKAATPVAFNMTNFKARIVALGIVLRSESPTQEST